MQTGPSHNLHIAKQLGRDFPPIVFRNMTHRDYTKVCRELSGARVTDTERSDGKTWRHWMKDNTVVASAIIGIDKKSVELMEVDNPVHTRRLTTIIRNDVRYAAARFS